MITRLSITNFKSIRQLDLDCKKVNVFIGEPNTGKSNIQETMAEFFERYGLILALEPNERVFKLQKEKQGKPRIIVNYPYVLQSDTLQRIIFYTIAMASNKDSVLVFEEPESNAFPYYTKYLGERIARDETNQFFVLWGAGLSLRRI
ncbi:MAG TPA: AAA family ATPase [Sedimentisphaerales bacterium]|nr:AAA family ATPase [Sedimentisphaerales bacterium]